VAASARPAGPLKNPSLPVWIAAALPSGVTIQYIDHADNVGRQRVLTVCEAAARLAGTT
jgi:hypothetical protein